jgi:hypothetical protein
VLIFEGKCSYFRVKPAHLVRHLPLTSQRGLRPGVRKFQKTTGWPYSPGTRLAGPWR